MKRDLFRRYVWLIDTIRHAGKIQFEEITERWLGSPLNDDGSQLALRTFHNHRNAIKSLFGIVITCDRSDGNRYYIDPGPYPNSTRLKVWMLQRLGLSELEPELDSRDVNRRIILDLPPEERYGITTVIDAIQNNKVVKIFCAIATRDHKTSLLFAPYCLRYWHGLWFVLGKDIETDIIHAFSLDRVLDINLTDIGFTYPSDFSSEEYLRDFYAMDIDSSIPPETVRLKVSGKTRDRIRTLPLHQSQKEIMINPDYSVFEYFLIPSDKFKKTILYYSPDAEIIFPLSLRDKMTEMVSRLYDAYRHIPGSSDNDSQ